MSERCRRRSKIGFVLVMSGSGPKLLPSIIQLSVPAAEPVVPLIDGRADRGEQRVVAARRETQQRSVSAGRAALPRRLPARGEGDGIRVEPRSF
jgi:hypothetical protein